MLDGLPPNGEAQPPAEGHGVLKRYGERHETACQKRGDSAGRLERSVGWQDLHRTPALVGKVGVGRWRVWCKVRLGGSYDPAVIRDQNVRAHRHARLETHRQSVGDGPHTGLWASDPRGTTRFPAFPAHVMGATRRVASDWDDTKR
jgi:hypothetical protein